VKEGVFGGKTADASVLHDLVLKEKGEKRAATDVSNFATQGYNDNKKSKNKNNATRRWGQKGPNTESTPKICTQKLTKQRLK
jgi:hypothetical protein